MWLNICPVPCIRRYLHTVPLFEAGTDCIQTVVAISHISVKREEKISTPAPRTEKSYSKILESSIAGSTITYGNLLRQNSTGQCTETQQYMPQHCWTIIPRYKGTELEQKIIILKI